MSPLISLPPPQSSSPSSPAPLLESASAPVTMSAITNHGQDINKELTSTPTALVATHVSSTFVPFTASTPLLESQSTMTPPATPPRTITAISSSSQSQTGSEARSEQGSETGELPAFFSAVLDTSSPLPTSMPRSPSMTAVSSFSDTGSNDSPRSSSPASAPALTPSRAGIQRAHVRAHTHTISLIRGGDIDPDADSDDDTFGVLHSFNSSPRIRAARKSLSVPPLVILRVCMRWNGASFSFMCYFHAYMHLLMRYLWIGIARSLSTEGSDPNTKSRSLSRERQEFNFERSRSLSNEPSREVPRPVIFASAPSASLLSPPFVTPSEEHAQPLLLAEKPQVHQAPEAYDEGKGKGMEKEQPEDVITIDTQSKQVHFFATESPEEGHRVKLNPAPPASSLPLRLPSTFGRPEGFSSNADAPPPAPVPAIIQLPPTFTAPQSAGLELDHRTPNVYINGLPPNYPESSLYTLTCPFGGVRSVRTFTRHVGGRAS